MTAYDREIAAIMNEETALVAQKKERYMISKAAKQQSAAIEEEKDKLQEEMIAKVIYPFTKTEVDLQKKSVFAAEKFAEIAEIHPKVVKALLAAKYETMTKIQKEGIPEIFKKENIALKSETGSGKTLTYLVPLISNLIKQGEEAQVLPTYFPFTSSPNSSLSLTDQAR